VFLGFTSGLLLFGGSSWQRKQRYAQGPQAEYCPKISIVHGGV